MVILLTFNDLPALSSSDTASEAHLQVAHRPQLL